MILKKTVVFLAVFTLLKTAIAQRVTIALSNKIKSTSGVTKGGIYINSLSLPNEELLTSFRMPPTGEVYFGEIDIFPNLKLMKFGKKLDVVKELDLHFLRKGNIGFLDVVKLKSNYYVLLYNINKDAATMAIEYQKLNTETLTVDEPKKLGTLQLSEYDKSNKIEASDLHIDYSPDSTKLLFTYEPDLKKKENKEVAIMVANADMTLKNELKHSFDVFYKKIRLHDVSVDNDGKVYLSYNLYAKDFETDFVKQDGKKIPSFTTNLCIIDGKQKEIYSFAGEGKFIHRSTIAYDENENICIIGLYKEKYDGGIIGAFKASIDKNKKTFGAPLVFDAFPQSVLDQVDTDGFGDKKGRDIGLYDGFNIRYSISILPEGSIRMISEYHTIVSGNLNTEQWGDILVTTFPPGNKTKPQYALISKYQSVNFPSSISARFRNYGYQFIGCSFELIFYNNKLLIFYNDHEDNLSRDMDKPPEVMVKAQKSNLMMAEINSKGLFVKNTFVLNHGDYDGYMTNMQFNYLRPNTYSVFALSMGFFKYGVKVGTLTIK